jgi:glycine/D-amino acid oxidase-like deaminating enzyme
MDFDYIILGQGVSGTFLSYYLHKAGKKVLVIDDGETFTASRIASGVINPVTGRRVVETWMINEIMPFAVNAYEQLGNEIGASVIQQCNVLSFHANVQMKQAFENRLPEDNNYLSTPSNEEELKQYFHFYLGVGETSPCYLADMQKLMAGWRKILLENGSLLEEKFDWNDCTVNENSVTYKTITAQKIFCCEGAAGVRNPYFTLLPYAKNKGEVLIMEISGLPRTHIYKQGLTIVPWKEDLFWIGSPYEWNYSDTHPTAAFKIKTQIQLQQWLKLPYKIIDHWAAERPANVERRPFAGLHPLMPSVGILNGMGTKGCSLAPYFAHQLTEHLMNNSPINPLADIARFTKVLGRQVI